MKKVSVIVPVYNRQEYLKDCLESIIHQNYSNLEILVVNDGSTDGSLKIANQYARQDQRIKVLNSPNMGISAARNHGIDCSTGDYLTFVDSDDWLDLRYVSTLIQQKVKYHSNIATTSFRVFHQDTGTYYMVMDPQPGDTHYDGCETNTQWLKTFLNCGWPFDGYIIGKLFDRTLFKNIRFPLSWSICEDEMTLWKLILVADTISFENKITYIHRTHHDGGSLVSDNEDQLYYSQSALLNEKLAIFRAAGVNTQYLHTHFKQRINQLNTAATKQGDFQTMMSTHLKQALIDKYFND